MQKFRISYFCKRLCFSTLALRPTSQYSVDIDIGCIHLFIMASLILFFKQPVLTAIAIIVFCALTVATNDIQASLM